MEDMLRGPAHRRPAAKRRSGRMMLFTCTALGAIHAGTCLSLDFAVQGDGGKSRALGFASRGTAFQQLAGVGGCAEGSNQRYGMGDLSSQRGICHGCGHASIRGARRGRVDSGLVRMQQMPGLVSMGILVLLLIIILLHSMQKPRIEKSGCTCPRAERASFHRRARAGKPWGPGECE
jgi:hypothetical protein